jgi:hypothetical protein
MNTRFSSPVIFVVFWVMQVFAVLAFKFGSTDADYWVISFVVGNAVVMASVWLMMILYTRIHPNVVLGVAFGGAFLLGQVSVVIAFQSPLSIVQSLGILVMAAGIAALALGGERVESA